jgi:hypothetical protein
MNSFFPGICFDSGDTATAQWYPQGATTVADMQADQSWGNGLRPILVSWYDHNNSGDGVNKGVRISFVDSVGGKYRHVLLVYPQIQNGIVTYDSVRVSQASFCHHKIITFLMQQVLKLEIGLVIELQNKWQFPPLLRRK